MPVVCAAVVGPAVSQPLLSCTSFPPQNWPSSCDSLQNNPLYLEAFYITSQDETLRFHYIVHCALDAVEEKGVCPTVIL